MTARVLRADRDRSTVLKGQVVDARTQAAELLADARREAQEIRERARCEGIERGRQEAAEEALKAHVENVRTQRAAIDELETQAIDLALMAAKQLIGEELALRPQRASEIVAKLLERVRRARRVTVHVHPDDEPAVSAAFDGATRSFLEVLPDRALARGDCVVESDIGTLDARLDMRLTTLKRALQRR